MYVSNYASSASSQFSSSAAASTGNTVDYQSFLKLLVAQMKNQDPTSPMESTDYVAQLATFSNVEQAVQVNAKLESLLQSSQMSQASSIIGRTVTSADGTISGKVSEVKLYSDGIIAILENGKEVPMLPGVKIS